MINMGKSLTNCDLSIQPVSCTLVLHRDKRSVSTTLEHDAHTGALFRDCLDVCQPDIPGGLELLAAHEHYPIIRQHNKHVATRKLEMGDVILVEVLSVVGCLEPKLAEGFPL